MDRVAPSVRRRADRRKSFLLFAFLGALALLLALIAVLIGRVAGNTPGGVASSLARNTDGFGECKQRAPGDWRCSTWEGIGASAGKQWQVTETSRGCWSAAPVRTGGLDKQSSSPRQPAEGCVTALDLLDGQDDFSDY